jgi:biopolymer transport protein ExbD/biopolymer transport protein TolR
MSGKGKSRLEFEDELDVTPLIDVAFLMQIFFMVSSTIAMAAAIVMPKAANTQAPDLTRAINLTIYHSENGPELFLSDGARENPATVEDVTAYVQDGINTGMRFLVIKADAKVASGYVEEVARAASDVEGIERYYVGVVDAPDGD